MHATTTATASKTSLVKHGCSFKLHRFCFITLNLSNVRDFSGGWVLMVCISVKKGKENRCLVFTISMRREIKKFSRRCRAVTAKKQKYLMHAQSCCKFCLSRVSVFVWKRIFFSPVEPTFHTHQCTEIDHRKRTFSITLSRVEIFKNVLGFYVWTDENGFEFGIRWCHTSYISSITHAQ